MAVTPPEEVRTVGDSTAGWTHKQLPPQHLQWLDALPLTQQLDAALLVHASADAPERWHYVYDERSATASLDAASDWSGVHYVFGGHVHEQSLYYRGSSHHLMKFTPQPGVPVPVPKHRQWLCTVGSAGQPRDGRPDSMYAMFDSERARLTFHRVPYDYAAAARAIRVAGLPEYFAERLERGR
jgi:diadenosine tetraphosphatase ApaH/serine/threonine PP2A family protein phosphatase